LFHADGQTDMTKLRVTFRNFENSTKNVANSAGEPSVGFHGIPSAVVSCTQTDRQTDRHGTARHSAVTEVNQDCSVGKVSTLQIQKSSSLITIRCRNKTFSLLQNIQACCVTTYRAIHCVAGVPSRGEGVKWPELEVNNSFHHHLVWID